MFDSILLSSLYFTILLGLLVVLGFRIKDNYSKKYFIFFVAGVFLFKYFLIISNEHYQLIENKKAGNFVIWYYVWLKEKGISGFLNADLNTSFFTQLLINLPGFHFFGGSRTNLLLTNSFFTSAAGVIAFLSFDSIGKRNSAWIALFLFSLYPSAICFSIFGLRDPIIYLLTTVYILLFLKWLRSPDFKRACLFLASLIFILFTRPESAAFLFILPIGYYVFRVYSKFKITNKFYGIKLSKSTLLIGVFSFLSLTTIGVYLFVLYNFGSSHIMPPWEFLDIYVNQRYSINLHSVRESSNILPPEIFFNLPWILKWPLQTVGMIFIPFPWLITNIWKFLALFDSLLIMYLLYLSKNTFISPVKEKMPVLLLMLTFFGSILIMGTLVSNAGNALRLRLSIVPFLFIAVILLLNNSKTTLPIWQILKK